MSLFDPNDFSLNLTIRIRESLYKYAYDTSLIMNMTILMLDPKKNLDLTKYNRKYKYKSKKEISETATPYLHKKDFSFKV